MLTVSEAQEAMPSHLRTHATQELVDKVNAAHSDPLIADQIKDNFLSYTRVLQEGRFKIEDYLNAVVYVSFKLMNYNNQESYARTFPQRYQALVARGASDKDISAYVAAYAKNKLVNSIMEQSLIPTWVLNQEMYQKALNTQADLMLYAKSELVRTQAANSLLTALKKPEKAQVELSVTAIESDGVKELREMLTSLAEASQAAIKSGVPTKQIAHQPLHPRAEAPLLEGVLVREINPQPEGTS